MYLWPQTNWKQNIVIELTTVIQPSQSNIGLTDMTSLGFWLLQIYSGGSREMRIISPHFWRQITVGTGVFLLELVNGGEVQT